jgi:hypothetical protein
MRAWLLAGESKSGMAEDSNRAKSPFAARKQKAGGDLNA